MTDRALVRLLLAAGATSWIAIAAIGGARVLEVVAIVCVWLILVALGGLTSDPR